MKILFTGGGTGGHIFPLVAIIRQIKKISPEKDLELVYIGPKDKGLTSILAQEGVKIRTVYAGKIRRYFTFKSFFQNLWDLLFKIPFGIAQAFVFLFLEAPDLIFSKGGYGSVPGVLSGWALQIPIFLHESDQTPGLANRLLEKFSLQVFTSFPDTEYFAQNKVIWVGNPVRKTLLKELKQDPKQILQLKSEKPVVLILGGSQGAQRINEVVLQVLAEMLVPFEVIHQIGSKNFEQVRREADVVVPDKLEKFYHPFPFLKEKQLTAAYRKAHLVVSRAGAGIIFELALLGKPSILIPLPEAAQNHQLKNAYAFAKTGATQVIEETNFTPHFFLEKIKFLLSRPSELERMAQKAQDFAKPRAAEVIATYIMGYLIS